MYHCTNALCCTGRGNRYGAITLVPFILNRSLAFHCPPLPHPTSAHPDPRLLPPPPPILRAAGMMMSTRSDLNTPPHCEHIVKTVLPLVHSAWSCEPSPLHPSASHLTVMDPPKPPSSSRPASN